MSSGAARQFTGVFWPWDIDPAIIEQRHSIAFIVTGILAFGTCLSTCIGVVRHLRRGGKKGVCIYTVRILLMAPAYSVPAWLALVDRLVALNEVLELCRKFYECIVIFAFTQLLVAQLGGFERLGYHLSNDDCAHLPPVRWVFDKYSWTPGTRFVRRSLSSVLQYPAVTLFVVPMALLSRLISPSVFHVFAVLCTGAVGASQMLAMYGLIIFYHANHVTLEPIRPVQKLVSIKLMVIATLWQAFVIRQLQAWFGIFEGFAERSETHWTAEQIAEATINGLIVAEMFILSSYHHCVYPPGEDLSHISPSPHAGAAPAPPQPHAVTAPVTGGSGAAVSVIEAGSISAQMALVEGAGAVATEVGVAEEVGRIPTMQRVRRWVGSDHWGSHVDGEQTQLTGCAICPTMKRFYHVFNITDIWKFYKELRKNYRTISTDNLDASNAARYAMGFFRARQSQADNIAASPDGAAPLEERLARSPS